MFAERVNKTPGYLPMKTVFQRGDANWVDNLSTLTTQYNKELLSSTKLAAIQTSLKKNEKQFIQNSKLIDKKLNLSTNWDS